jgi:hypothetical protein
VPLVYAKKYSPRSRRRPSRASSLAHQGRRHPPGAVHPLHQAGPAHRDRRRLPRQRPHRHGPDRHGPGSRRRGAGAGFVVENASSKAASTSRRWACPSPPWPRWSERTGRS